MKRINFQLLTREILKQAPHRRSLAQSTSIFRQPKVSRQQLKKADSLYLDQFVYHIFCGYLTDPSFQMIKFNNIPAPQNLNNFKPFKEEKTIKKRSPAEIKLLNTIKLLNDYKCTFIAYSQAKETVETMSKQEAKKYKKYLIHIYKILTNMNKPNNLDKQSLANDVKVAVITKIYEGHECLQQQKKLKQQLQQIQKENEEKDSEGENSESESIDKMKRKFEMQSQIFKETNKDKQ